MDWQDERQLQDTQERLRRQDMQDKKNNNHLEHSWITEHIINSCFEIIKDLGSGFIESVYKNSLYLSLVEKKLRVETEKPYEVHFKERKVGLFKADLVVENLVIVELKCCSTLLPEHQAQSINYLKASNLPICLLINFGNRKLEFKRLHHPKNL